MRAPRIPVLSISRHTRDILKAAPSRCRELGRSRRAVNLLVSSSTGEPTVVALVTPEVGNGPFHVVVPRLPAPMRKPVDTLWRAGTWHLGPAQYILDSHTPVWDPAPPWDAWTLPDARPTWLQARASMAYAGRSIQSNAAQATNRALGAALDRLLPALSTEDLLAAGAAAASLAGLGAGLTPEGDDILAGVMLALFAAHHPDAARMALALYTAAAARTTLLSRAFLAAASRGEATEPWHVLLAALAGGAGPAPGTTPAAASGGIDPAPALVRVLNCGATSGAAMLWGFVRAYAQIRSMP